MPDTGGTGSIAPCGMNCTLCYAYLQKKKSCLGCRGTEFAKPDHCRVCKIKTCAETKGLTYCLECKDFPCLIIKRMDKSYRQRYQASLIINGERVREVGMDQFLLEEKEKWACPDCGGVICLHDKICSDCGKAHIPGSTTPP